MGLTLSRKESESIQIGDDITITVFKIKGNRVNINIDAPKDLKITRPNTGENTYK